MRLANHSGKTPLLGSLRCPECRRETIPFSTVYFKSGFGVYRCQNCGARCRAQGLWTIGNAVTSGLLGALVGAVFVATGSLFVLLLALAAALYLDALKDRRLLRLQSIEPKRERWWTQR